MFRFVCVAVLVTAFSTATAQEKKDAPAKEPEQQVKVFRLQLCDPDEVMEVLQQLLERSGVVGEGEEAAEIPARLTVDVRSGAVIVRGLPDQIEIAAETIGVLESPADKPLPKTKRIQAVSLKHATPADVASVSSSVELPVRVVALSELKMVIGAGAESALRQWSNMVRDLDAPDRKIEMNRMRRLGVGGVGGTAGFVGLPMRNLGLLRDPFAMNIFGCRDPFAMNIFGP